MLRLTPSRSSRILAGILLTLLGLVLAYPAFAQGLDTDGDGIEDAEEQALLDTHAPILYFHPEETYFPVSIEYALDHCVLERWRVGRPSIIVDPTPNGTELAAFGTFADPQVNPGGVYYLNNTLGDRRNDSGIQASYEAGNYPRTVYARVSPDNAQTVIQYWFYYAFNPGVWNNHEGDWEMVQVQLSGTDPTQVAFAQHHGGVRMPWDDPNAALLPVSVLRDGTHPQVYVALGSHASYVRPYQKSLGLAADIISDQGPVWRPGDYTLVNVGEQGSPTPGNEWVEFAGRWGEFSVPAYVRGEAGPLGPAFRSRGTIFETPVAWADALRVPSVFLLTFQWFVDNFWTIFLIILGIGVAVTVIRIALVQRRTKAGVRVWPYSHLLPFDRKSVALALALVGITVGVVGFFFPWYEVSVDIDAPGVLDTGGLVTFLEIGGTTAIRINPLKVDATDSLVEFLPLPLATMFLILSVYFVFQIAGAKTSRRLGLRFFGRGFVLLLPFIAVLILTFYGLFGLLEGLAPSGVDPNIILDPVFADPFGGSTDVPLPGGAVTVEWGMGLGIWLLFIAGGLMIAAALLAMSQRYEFLPPKSKGAD